MLKISRSKPKIILVKAHNDMSHFTPTHYSVFGNNWFYMSPEEYMNKKEFEEFKVKHKDFTPKQVDEMIEKAKSGKEVSFVECIGNNAMMNLYNIQQELKKSGNQIIWQYNVVDGNLKTWRRECSVFGAGVLGKNDFKLKILNPFDIYIKIPVLNFICNAINKTLRFKQEKEQRDWDKKLKDIHREAK